MIDFNKLPEAEVLTPAQIEALLPELDGLISWAKAVQAYALEQAVTGAVAYKGYKVVAGKSNRVITDEVAVLKILEEEGFEPDTFYERKLKGLSSIEALVGKAKFNKLVGKYIDKPLGKPTLVPADDPREAYNALESARLDFKD